MKLLIWASILLIPFQTQAFPMDFEASDSEIGSEVSHSLSFYAPLLTTRIEIDWSDYGVGEGAGVDLAGIDASDVDLTGLTPLGLAAVLGSIDVDNELKIINLYILIGLAIGGEVGIEISGISNPPTPLPGVVQVTTYTIGGSGESANSLMSWTGGRSDQDGDRMPDGFESYYHLANPAYRNAGLNPQAFNSPSDDFDGDGASNLREFLGSTNPIDPTSFPSTADSDSDYIYDIDESYPGEVVDTDNDGTPDAEDLDSDNDGISDEVEAGDKSLQTAAVDTDGDGIPDFQDTDSDGDGVFDGLDNCRTLSNTNQEDNDGDETGDACDLDDDNDGVVDEEDNCRLVANSDQTDANEDGVGDKCESDLDGDGIQDEVDNCPLVKNENQRDFDGDKVGDVCDTDDDNDMVVDPIDNCQFVPNPDQSDSNDNGIGDACDIEGLSFLAPACSTIRVLPTQFQIFGFWLPGAFSLLFLVYRRRLLS